MTAATSASPTSTPAASAGAVAPAEPTTIDKPNVKPLSKGAKLFALTFIAVVQGGFLWFNSYSRTTPHGKESFVAEMRRDEIESNNKLAIAQTKVRLAEIELQREGCNK